MVKTSSKYGLMEWVHSREYDDQIVVEAFQRWYVWRKETCKSLIYGAIKNLLLARKLNVQLSEIPKSLGCISINIIDTIISILNGQQRILTLLILHKALADVSLLSSNKKMYNSIMNAICDGYCEDEVRVPVLYTKKKLDREDLEIIFNWDPTLEVLSLKKISKIAEKIGTIDEESPILRNYLYFIEIIMDILKNGFEGENISLEDIYRAIENIKVLVDESSQYSSSTELFIESNQNYEKVSDYALFVAYFAEHIETSLNDYIDNVECSRQFRINQEQFLKLIATYVFHDSDMKGASFAHLKKSLDNACNCQHKGTYSCYNSSYESICSRIFSVYGNAFVAMLEEDETFIPADILLRLRDMKALNNTLWQTVAMGAVQLLEKKKVERISDLDEKSLSIIKQMFDLFIQYSIARKFVSVKGSSIVTLFRQFFVEHSFVDAHIVSEFSDFLNHTINERGKMPTDKNAIIEQMTTKKIDNASACVVLKYMDKFVNVDRNINYDKYNTAEHIAPLSQKRTKNYNLTKKQRECFANITILAGNENTDANNDDIVKKSELIYNNHPLALVNCKNLRKDINIREDLAPNHFTEWNVENMRKRAEALAELLLMMKKEYFGN